MNIDDAFPSAYLKHSDLQGREVTVYIGEVTIEKFDEGTKPILHFQGKDKALSLNITNKNVIKKVYGSETTAWTGQPLTLYPATTEFKGDTVPCIRVKIPEQNGPGQSAQGPPPQEQPPMQQAPQQSPNPMDDDLPF
jgi:hypothetical protein|tara:strand:- start:6289 stop:6699 length:411 start_codon:yes stop_codon:yes gene_type:complete